jgi:capsular exopolysaccharide synthesis family protein
MEQMTYPRQTGSNGKSFNKKMILPAVFRNWYWFILAAILGLGAAFVFTKAIPGNFKDTMTILLIDQVHPAPIGTSLDNNTDIQQSPINVQDEQAVLSAYSLQLQTLQNLNWKTRWYKKTLLSKKDIYPNDPYQVSFRDDSTLKGVDLLITPLSDKEYSVECDYKDRPADTVRIIRFTGKGAFGHPFINQYFNFTLSSDSASPPADGTQYVLVFNDLGFMALDYQGALEVKLVSPLSNVLNVDLTGENILRNVAYLDELGNTYLKFGLDQKNQSAINTLNFIRNQLTGVADSLRASSDRYTDFRTKHQVVDLTTEGGLVLQKAEDADKQENLLKLKLDYYNQLNNHLNDQGDIKGFASAAVGDVDPDLSVFIEKLATLYSQRSNLSQTLQSKNPKLVAVNEDITLTQQLIKNDITSHLTSTQDQINRIEHQKQQIDTRLTDFPATERGFLDIKRGFDVNGTLYNFLLQKRAEAGIALASNNADAKILDPAVFPTTGPVGLKSILTLAIGVILGLFITLGIILLKVYLNNRLKDPEQVTAALHLSVAGNILHNKFKTALPVTQYPRSEMTESFRNLRANLRYLLKESDSGIIAIHSAVPEEGKSFIASNLAALLAAGNKKILLLQTDKHNTSLEETVGAKPSKDLTDYLTGTAAFSELPSQTDITGLSFIRAGSPDSHLSEGMDNLSAMQQFFRDARAAFDFIIIDTAPISILSDARTIAPYADINLFVLRIGFSTVKELSFINTTADEETIKNMIVVLNDTPVSRRKKKTGYFKD